MPDDAILEEDLTGKVSRKSGNLLGAAHEHYVIAILMRLGFNGLQANFPNEIFDMLINGFDKDPNKHEDAKKIFLRAQVKTASSSVSFKGGVRSGKDRTYNAEENVDKSYQYNSDMVELVIGVDRNTLDLYIIPIEYVEEWGSSKSTNKLEPLKNRWELLLNWNDEYIEEVKYELPDFEREENTEDLNDF